MKFNPLIQGLLDADLISEIKSVRFNDESIDWPQRLAELVKERKIRDAVRIKNSNR